MTYAYGTSADTQDPADVAANQKLYGVDNAAAGDRQVPPRRRHLLRLDRQRGEPAPDRRPLQRPPGRRARAAARQCPSLIATDQEGGIVARIGPPATQFPGTMALGAGRSTADAQTAAADHRRRAARDGHQPELRARWPTSTSTRPTRSSASAPSASDPGAAASLTAARCAGYSAAGDRRPPPSTSPATATPPPTATPACRSSTTPARSGSRSTRRRSGPRSTPGVDAIMTAHIVVPALDPSGDPATLSKPIITGLLRDELGYHGVIVTDALDMAGVRAKYGDDRVPVLALEAGVDLLLMPPTSTLAYNAVMDAVADRRADRGAHRRLGPPDPAPQVRARHRRGPVRRREPGRPPGRHPRAPGRGRRRSPTAPPPCPQRRGLLPLRRRRPGVLVTGWGVTTDRRPWPSRWPRAAPPPRCWRPGSTRPTAADRAAAAAAARHDLTVVLTNRAWASADPAASSSSWSRRWSRPASRSSRSRCATRTTSPPPERADLPGHVLLHRRSRWSRWPGCCSASSTRTGTLPVDDPRAGPTQTLYPFGHGLRV